jgi:hypothetical protein
MLWNSSSGKQVTSDKIAAGRGVFKERSRAFPALPGFSESSVTASAAGPPTNERIRDWGNADFADPGSSQALQPYHVDGLTSGFATSVSVVG